MSTEFRPNEYDWLESPPRMIQVRTNKGGLFYFDSLPAAIQWAEENEAWKVSFPVGESRCRLVRTEGYYGEAVWVYQPIEIPS